MVVTIVTSARSRSLELSKVKGDWPSQFLVISVTVVTIFRKTLTNSLSRALIGVKYRTALAQFLPVTVRSKVSRFHAPCTVTGIVPPSPARTPHSDYLRGRTVTLRASESLGNRRIHCKQIRACQSLPPAPLRSRSRQSTLDGPWDQRSDRRESRLTHPVLCVLRGISIREAFRFLTSHLDHTKRSLYLVSSQAPRFSWYPLWTRRLSAPITTNSACP
jgi:hypothetical protein